MCSRETHAYFPKYESVRAQISQNSDFSSIHRAGTAADKKQKRSCLLHAAQKKLRGNYTQ